MRKLLAGSAACLLIACSLFAGTTVAGSLPTAAAPACDRAPQISSQLLPATLVLGPDEQRLVVQSSQVPSRCVASIRTDLLSPTFATTVDLSREPGQAAGWTAHFLISSRDLTNADAGRWRSRMRGQGTRPFRSTGGELWVLRATRLSARITHPPHGDESVLMLTGRLTRADWETGRYHGLATRTLQLQRRTSTGGFRRVRDVTTDREGVVRAPIAGDGCFRFVFAGGPTTAGGRSGQVCTRLP